MRSKRLSAASLLPTLAALLLPAVVSSQNVVDLPGRDRALGVEEEEIFSVGSIAGDDWETFSTVTGVAFDGEGNLYILDTQNFRVVKVGPQGQFIAEMGRAGGGPGEFEDMMWIKKTRGDSLLVYDWRHRRLSVLDPQADFTRSYELDILTTAGGFPVITESFSDGHLLLATEMTSCPVTPGGQVIFGVGCGVLSMSLKLYLDTPIPAYLAVLVMNTFTPSIDAIWQPRVFGQRHFEWLRRG